MSASPKEAPAGPRKKVSTTFRNILQSHQLVSDTNTPTRLRTSLRDLLPSTPPAGVDVQQLLTRFTGIVSQHVVQLAGPAGPDAADAASHARSPARHSLDLLCVAHLLRLMAPFRAAAAAAAPPLAPEAVRGSAWRQAASDFMPASTSSEAVPTSVQSPGDMQVCFVPETDL